MMGTVSVGVPVVLGTQVVLGWTVLRFWLFHAPGDSPHLPPLPPRPLGGSESARKKTVAWSETVGMAFVGVPVVLVAQVILG